MSCIHFKFSNTVENEKLKFDGLQISVADLRDAIIKLKNLKANLYTLKIIDAQTKKEYSDETQMLPRNSSVIVSRIPLSSALRAPKSKFKEPSIPLSETTLPGLNSIRMKSAGPKGLSMDEGMLSAEELRQTPDLANANASEDAKVKAMMMQSTDTYDPSQYVWTPRGSSGGVPGSSGHHMGLKKNPPPPTYTCYRCGNRGHWIQMCPTNGDPNYNNYRYKRSMGTPSSQLVTVNEGVQGAMLDHNGQLVVRAVDLAAIESAKMKKQKRIQVLEEPKKDNKPPDELICSICKEVMKEAVIIPCCGESFCSECIWMYLCDNDFTCPACKKEGVSPENLAPNKALRQSAKNFLSKAAEEKCVAVASSTGFVKKSPITITPKPPAVTVTPATSVVSNVAESSPVVKRTTYNPITKPITVSPSKPAVMASSAVKREVKLEEAKLMQVESRQQVERKAVEIAKASINTTVNTENVSQRVSPNRGMSPAVVPVVTRTSPQPKQEEAVNTSKLKEVSIAAAETVPEAIVGATVVVPVGGTVGIPVGVTTRTTVEATSGATAGTTSGTTVESSITNVVSSSVATVEATNGTTVGAVSGATVGTTNGITVGVTNGSAVSSEALAEVSTGATAEIPSGQSKSDASVKKDAVEGVTVGDKGVVSKTESVAVEDKDVASSSEDVTAAAAHNIEKKVKATDESTPAATPPHTEASSKEEKKSLDKQLDVNLLGVSLGAAAPAALGLMATKPAVPLTSIVPLSSNNILGQSLFPAQPSVLLPGATMPGMPGASSLMAGSMGALGPAPQHLSSSTVSKGDPSKLDKLAAELLLTTAVSKKKPSSPPLSIDEFYRHQKLLKLLTKDKGGRRSGSRSRSHSHSTMSYSRSSSLESGDSYLSDSYSDSSGSDSDYSRSRSRSPQLTRKAVASSSRHSRKHKHERPQHRHERIKDKEKKAKSRRERREKRTKELMREEKEMRRAGSRERSKRYKEERSKHHRHSRRKGRDGSLPQQMERELKEERSGRRHRRRRHHSEDRSPEKKRKRMALDVERNLGVGRVSPLPDMLQVSPAHRGMDSELSNLSDEEYRRLELKARHKRSKKRRHEKTKRRSRRASVDLYDTTATTGATENQKSVAPVEEAEELQQPKEITKTEQVAVAAVAAVPEVTEGKEGVSQSASLKVVSPRVAETESTSQSSSPSGGTSPPVAAEVTETTEIREQPLEKEATGNVSPRGGVTVNNGGVVSLVDGVAGTMDTNVPSQNTDLPSQNTDVPAEDEHLAADAEFSEAIEVNVKEEFSPIQEGEVKGTPSLTKEAPVVNAPDPLTEDDFANILVELESVKDWKSLGLELRVPARKLSQIQHKYPVESLEQVIHHWLASEGSSSTWNYLVAALKKIGEASTAARISRKYISKDLILSKEEGELSDSEDEHKPADLRNTLSSLRNEVPDLRETINSQKAPSRKRPSPTEIPMVNSNVASPPKRPRKVSGTEVVSIASSMFTPRPSEELSESEASIFTADDSQSSETSNDEEEEINNILVKKNAVIKKHESSSSARKKVEKVRHKHGQSHGKNDGLVEQSHSRRRHRCDPASEGSHDRKKRKEKKHKHSSKDHKHSSHKSAKKSSRLEKGEKRKLKKHKKSSGHSARSYHVH